MRVSYLNDKCWAQVTREERFFCAHLWGLIRGDRAQQFGEHLTKLPAPSNGLAIPWFNGKLAERIAGGEVREVGFEVCFYRDWPFGEKDLRSAQKTVGDAISNSALDRSAAFPDIRKGFLKRTFDLCLFLDNEIVIVEAKAQQGFGAKQMSTFQEDRLIMGRILQWNPEQIHLVAITSSRYENPRNSTRQIFSDGGWITWKFLAGCYATDPILAHADLTYGASNYTQDEDAQ
jgi:hypothetical protein